MVSDGSTMYVQRAPRSTPNGLSEDSLKKAQFQQKQMVEKEKKLLDMLDSQQQRAMRKGALSGEVKKSGSSTGGGIPLPAGKVRQMFEERRKTGGTGIPTTPYRNGGIVGIDKSYPLEPIMSRSSSSKSDPTTTSVKRTTPVSKTPTPISKTPTPISKTQTSMSKTPTPNSKTPSPTRAPPLSPLKSRGSGTRTPTPSTRNSSGSSVTSPSSLLRRSSSSGQRGFSDENGNMTPTTTKYSDFYGEELANREAQLGTKLRNMAISPVDRRNPPPAYSPPKLEKSPQPKKSAGKVTPVKSPSPVKTPTVKSPVGAKSPIVRTGPPPPGLEECKICHRCFASDRISKHESICKKTTAASKKRKVFDPTKMRMQGTEAEPYIRIVSAKAAKPAPPKAKKADWRKKHEEFINTIRAAKEYQKHVDAGGNPADLPPPPPSDNSDYIQCPHCGRKFNEAAASRHIPKCKDIKSNKR